MKVVTTFQDARAAAEGLTGLVPTMGYFHEGHLSLMRLARTECETVWVSLFVNPLQFGPSEDLDTYPRDFERDAALAEREGVDVLFAPPADDMYPPGHVTRVNVEPLTQGLCGPFRPGHFEGVATAVAKLFGGLQPDRAYLGMKDAQQLAVVRRMAADLSFPVEVVGGSTVREEDGLALSSRNVYLSPAARTSALSISRGLFAAGDAVRAGERDGPTLEQIVASAVGAAGDIELQYAELVDAATTVRLDRLDRRAFLAAAARVGGTRLIDNVWFTPHADGFVIDSGRRLEGPSVIAGGT